ncbi:MAG: hypothetical protein HYY04_06710 [Chloroflexi bacterium]|nr:hypothetical protein [Chloroflexota bacterium]
MNVDVTREPTAYGLRREIRPPAEQRLKADLQLVSLSRQVEQLSLRVETLFGRIDQEIDAIPIDNIRTQIKSLDDRMSDIAHQAHMATAELERRLHRTQQQLLFLVGAIVILLPLAMIVASVRLIGR